MYLSLLTCSRLAQACLMHSQRISFQVVSWSCQHSDHGVFGCWNAEWPRLGNISDSVRLTRSTLVIIFTRKGMSYHKRFRYLMIYLKPESWKTFLFCSSYYSSRLVLARPRTFYRSCRSGKRRIHRTERTQRSRIFTFCFQREMHMPSHAA